MIKYTYVLMNDKGIVREEFRYLTTAENMKFYFEELYLEKLVIRKIIK